MTSVVSCMLLYWIRLNEKPKKSYCQCLRASVEPQHTYCPKKVTPTCQWLLGVSVALEWEIGVSD
jgi:hypothetical protein